MLHHEACNCSRISLVAMGTETSRNCTQRTISKIRVFGCRSSYNLSWISAVDGDWWSTPRPGRLSSRKIYAVVIVQETGWAPGQVWTSVENIPHQNSISGPSSSSRFAQLTLGISIGNTNYIFEAEFCIWHLKKVRWKLSEPFPVVSHSVSLLPKNLCHLQQQLRPSADPLPICHVDQMSLCLCSVLRMPTYGKNVFLIIAMLYEEERHLCCWKRSLQSEGRLNWVQERCQRVDKVYPARSHSLWCLNYLSTK